MIMASELIANVIGTVTIAGYLCYLIYKNYRQKKALRRLILRYMQDSFLNEYDYMKAYQAMLRKTCKKNAE